MTKRCEAAERSRLELEQMFECLAADFRMVTDEFTATAKSERHNMKVLEAMLKNNKAEGRRCLRNHQ